MTMLSVFKYTPRDRRGGIDGLNLFFGALLGANLGTLDGLTTEDYVKLIALLACTIMSLRMLSTSERRWLILISLAVYCGFLAMIYVTPQLQPEGLPADDLNKLLLTIAIWVVSVVSMEFWPVHHSEAAPPPDEGEEAQA